MTEEKRDLTPYIQEAQRLLKLELAQNKKNKAKRARKKLRK